MEPTIVIIGGSFNPPTLAHIQLAKIARKRVNADFVLMVPAKTSYMQEWKQYQNSDIFKDEMRLRALRALESEWMKLETCEIDNKVSGSTYDTINYIKEKYNSSKVYFAIGSDKLEEIPRWYNNKELLKRNKFLVVQRNNDLIESIIEKNHFLSIYKSSFICCETEYKSLQKVSSTVVRNYIEQGKLTEVENLVPKDVYSIILGVRASINITGTKKSH